MKKNVLKTLLTLIAVFSVIFVGCATGNNDESIPEGYIRINYQGAPRRCCPIPAASVSTRPSPISMCGKSRAAGTGRKSGATSST